MNNKEKGRAGEERAARFLEEKGIRTIERNFYTRYGEIDLVSVYNSSILFVEVKNWRNFGAEDLARVMNAGRKRRMIKTAKIFLLRHPEYAQYGIRFDLILIHGIAIDHFENVIMENDVA